MCYYIRLVIAFAQNFMNGQRQYYTFYSDKQVYMKISINSISNFGGDTNFTHQNCRTFGLLL